MRRRRTCVLVVEDNEDIRVLLEALLQDDLDLYMCASAFEALATLEFRTPDVLVFDISLPGMDGLELLRTVRAQRTTAGIPAIALTAHAMSGDREAFLEAGFDGYVAKPIMDEAVLLACIEKLAQQA